MWVDPTGLNASLPAALAEFRELKIQTVAMTIADPTQPITVFCLTPEEKMLVLQQ